MNLISGGQFKPTLPRKAASDLRSPAWLLICGSRRKSSGAPAARGCAAESSFQSHPRHLNQASGSTALNTITTKAKGARAPYLTIYSAFPCDAQSAPYIAKPHTCTLGSRGWQRERAASKVDVRGR